MKKKILAEKKRTVFKLESVFCVDVNHFQLIFVLEKGFIATVAVFCDLFECAHSVETVCVNFIFFKQNVSGGN